MQIEQLRDLSEYLSQSLAGVVEPAEGGGMGDGSGGGGSRDLEMLSKRWVWRRERNER